MPPVVFHSASDLASLVDHEATRAHVHVGAVGVLGLLAIPKCAPTVGPKARSPSIVVVGSRRSPRVDVVIAMARRAGAARERGDQ
jgi:hypothetical protein